MACFTYDELEGLCLDVIMSCRVEVLVNAFSTHLFGVRKKNVNVPTGLYFAIVAAISNSLKPKYLVFNSLTFRMFPTGH